MRAFCLLVIFEGKKVRWLPNVFKVSLRQGEKNGRNVFWHNSFCLELIMHDYKIIDKPYGAIGFHPTIASGLSFYFYLSIKVGSLGGKFLQGDFSCQFISDFYFLFFYQTPVEFKADGYFVENGSVFYFASSIFCCRRAWASVRGRACVGVRAYVRAN